MTDRERTYAEKLSRMIQVETVSEKGKDNKEKFDRFHAVLRELFPLLFSKAEVVEIDSSLLIRIPGKGKGEPILFMSHQDVVEATGEWENPPFSGAIKDGKVWGRGTVDTKGSLFCIMQAAEEIIESGEKLDVDLYIASSSTEEIAGSGAPKTVEYLRKNNVHLQFLLDEGGMIKAEPMKGVNGRFAMIGCLEKGTGNFRFIARSNGGHASAPTPGTPLVRLGAFMDEIEKHDPCKARMNETVIEMFRRFGPYTSGVMGFVFRHARIMTPLLNSLLPRISPLGAAMIKTTIAFTMAKGSDGLNVLPQEAWVNANIRFIHHQGVDRTYEILKPIAEKHGIEIVKDTCRDAYPVVDYTGKPFRLVESTIKEMFPGVIPTPYAMTGGTDASFYAPVTDNAIRFAPLEIDEQQYRSIHALNENISIDVLPGGVDFYKAIARKAK